ncbi:MAG: hypothetical protein V4647_13115, partial [Pseudomonadota bacterium]
QCEHNPPYRKSSASSPNIAAIFWLANISSMNSRLIREPLMPAPHKLDPDHFDSLILFECKLTLDGDWPSDDGYEAELVDL